VDASVALHHERAVIIGNGNVALDVARFLTTDPDRLAHTSIAPHALAALRENRVREVVVLGRRGPLHAAFTLPELVGLAARSDIDLRVEAPECVDVEAAPDAQTRLKLEYLAEIAARPAPGDDLPRIVLRFHAAPVEIIGDSGVEGLRVVRTDTVVDADGRTRVVPRTPDSDSEETIPAGLVLTSVGYRGVPVPGVPFDPD